MKSTLKVDLSTSIPVIKVIQPLEVVQYREEDDCDVRDKILKEFLHSPSKAVRNELFSLHTYFPHPMENPTLYVTTIAAIPVENYFETFKCQIMSKMVPYYDRIEFAKGNTGIKQGDVQTTEKSYYQTYKAIEDFFAMLEKTEWATFEQQHPSHHTMQGTV